MPEFNKETSINSLRDLLFDQLRDIHSVESQLVAALRELEAAATAPALRDFFREHAAASETQRARIESIFHTHGLEPGGDKSKAMEGLLEGGGEHVATAAPGAVRDALIVAHTTRIEHYEIAAYSVTLAIAESLDAHSEAEILADCLEVENRAAAELARLANGGLFRDGLNDIAAKESGWPS